MNICFLMYPWEEIDPVNDTSLALIHECVRRGHGVALCTPANLTIRNMFTINRAGVIFHACLNLQFVFFIHPDSFEILLLLAVCQLLKKLTV